MLLLCGLWIGQGFIKLREHGGASALFILFFSIPMVSYHPSIPAYSPSVNKRSVSIYYVPVLCTVLGTQKQTGQRGLLLLWS